MTRCDQRNSNHECFPGRGLSHIFILTDDKPMILVMPVIIIVFRIKEWGGLFRGDRKREKEEEEENHPT